MRVEITVAEVAATCTVGKNDLDGDIRVNVRGQIDRADLPPVVDQGAAGINRSAGGTVALGSIQVVRSSRAARAVLAWSRH